MTYTAPGSPQMPPPDITLTYCDNHDLVSVEMLMQYMNRYLYIWPYEDEGFWFYPTSLEGNYLQGYAWADGDWKYDQLTWRQIDSFF